MRPPTRFLARAALAAASVSIPFGLAECVCRIHGSYKVEGSAGAFIQFDDELGWSNRPEFNGRHTSHQFDVAVRTDRHGYRVGADQPDRPTSILAIGDSMTFGWGVEFDETCSSRLGKRLGVGVRNAGVSGYGAGQQLLRLRQTLSQHPTPRVVLVTHVPNDLEETARGWSYGGNKPRFAANDGGKLELLGAPVRRTLSGYSFLWRTVEKRLGLRQPPEALTPTERRDAQRLILAIYRQMHRECINAGATIVFVARDAAWLETGLSRFHARYVDAGPALAQLGDRATIAGDFHWTASAHAAVANRLTREIHEILDQQASPSSARDPDPRQPR